MRSVTQSVTVHAGPDALFDFLAEPRNLPKWAIGFCRDIREHVLATKIGVIPGYDVTSTTPVRTADSTVTKHAEAQT